MRRTRAVAVSTHAVSPVSMAPKVPVAGVAGTLAVHSMTAQKAVNKVSGFHRLARKVEAVPVVVRGKGWGWDRAGQRLFPHFPTQKRGTR